jgi:Bax protein
MRSLLWPVLARGRLYAFPAIWAAVLVAGVSLRQPVSPVDISTFLSFNTRSHAHDDRSFVPPMQADTAALIFVRHDLNLLEPEEQSQYASRDLGGGHGRFAAPGNAVRRQAAQLRPINPKTADELAGFLREASFSLTDVRQGVEVPALKVERVPDDLVTKGGDERKQLFIAAILPVVLDINQRVLAEREQLLTLRNRLVAGRTVSAGEQAWLANLAERYDTPADRLDELVKKVDIVPPSMAIAQSGVESGWGTSFAARTGNALFGQIQSVGTHAVSVPWRPGNGMPQPFANVGEAAEAYVINLNTHPAYAGFRNERAAMRQRGETPNGYSLVGTLLRYSELGGEYVRFVRQIMRENNLADFDKARLSGT